MTTYVLIFFSGVVIKGNKGLILYNALLLILLCITFWDIRRMLYTKKMSSG